MPESTPSELKVGGVCSMRVGDGQPIIMCPSRFDAEDLLPKWLARIVGFGEVYLAREVPFMRSPSTGRAAGRIDMVVSADSEALDWYGLEIQAVYFSGERMQIDFEILLNNMDELPPEPTRRRRPDYRSSSAKRLMPQLQVKAPTLRRWRTKLAVAVDLPFFEEIGGPSERPSKDLNDGDIIWLVPRIDENYVLMEHHWEVLSLEASEERLLSAETVPRSEFEDVLRSKLFRLSGSISRGLHNCPSRDHGTRRWTGRSQTEARSLQRLGEQAIACDLAIGWHGDSAASSS